jgi:glutamate carboxypeptidase
MRPPRCNPVALKTLALLLALPLSSTAVAAEGGKNVQLYERAGAVKPQFISLLQKLVSVDSGTGSEKGLDQVGAMVAEEMKKRGMQVELVSSAPAAGHNLVGTLKGKGKAKILLLAHMDTVFADGSAAARPFRIEGDRAYGPGVMDDKGGIVMALEAISLLQGMQFDDFAQLTLMINTNEETFSKGSFPLIEKLAKAHDVTLSMEPGRAADGLVIWRKGSGDLRIDVKGKSSHAGVAPEAGRNAAMEAAHQMLQMANLGDASKGTTVNFTVFQSGDRSNVIPDTAVVKGDMRVRDAAEFTRVEQAMAQLSRKQLIAGTQVTTSVTRGMAPMSDNPATQALAARAQAIYGELGMKLTMEGSGGAGDANYTSGVAAPTLDGFGIVGGNIHTENEYAELNSIVPRLYLLTRMIVDVSTKR